MMPDILNLRQKISCDFKITLYLRYLTNYRPYPMQLFRDSILQGQHHLLPLRLACFRAYTSSTSLPICLCTVSEPLAAKQSNDPAITIDNNIIAAVKISFYQEL
jgi:hypothetical protein